MVDDATTKEVNVEELQTQLNSAIERARNFEGKLADIEKTYQHIDPDKYLDMKERLRILETEKDKQSAIADPDAWKAETKTALEQQVRESVQSELEEWKTKAESSLQKLYEYEVIDKAYSEISDLFLEKASPYVKDAIRKNIAKDEEGNLFVKTEKGEKRFSSKNAKEAFSVKDWGKEFAESNPFFARPQTKNSGMPSVSMFSSANNSKDPEVVKYLNASPEERKQMFSSPLERGQFIRKHNIKIL